MKQDKAANGKDSSISHDLGVYRKAAKLAYDYQKKRAEEDLEPKENSSVKKEESQQEQNNGSR